MYNALDLHNVHKPNNDSEWARVMRDILLFEPNLKHVRGAYHQENPQN